MSSVLRKVDLFLRPQPPVKSSNVDSHQEEHRIESVEGTGSAYGYSISGKLKPFFNETVIVMQYAPIKIKLLFSPASTL